MEWFRANHVAMGVLADTLTFAGGCIMARDAFFRLRDLKWSRIDGEFRRMFPKLNLTGDGWKAAVLAFRWTLAGFGLVVPGFLLQPGLRVMGA